MPLEAAPDLASVSRSNCKDYSYQCGDCFDNDGDGFVDALDSECLVATTHRGLFSRRNPGQNDSQCRQDCYFDEDHGAGNYDCYWSHRCDRLSMAPAYPPSGDERCAFEPMMAVPGSALACAELEVSQSERCSSFCGEFTPNGCDCFGCCELPAGAAVTSGSGRPTRPAVVTPHISATATGAIPVRPSPDA